MTTTVNASETRTATMNRNQAMRLAEEAYDRFADAVDLVGDTAWDLPTDCSEWTVRDLVGHMVGAMRSAASVRELLSQRREISRIVKRTGANETDTMTAVQVQRTADLSTPKLVTECRRLVPKAATGRRRIPWLARRFVSFPVEIGDINEPWRLDYLVDVILTRDAWLHRIDLCRAIGTTPHVTAEHDGIIVADVVAEWAGRHGQPHHLVLTGPAGGVFSSGSGRSEPPVEVDAIEFCRIVSGRAEGEGLLATFVPF